MKLQNIVVIAAASLLSMSCGKQAGKKFEKPESTGLNIYWGDIHNHCNLTYGHGDMRDAFEAARQ